MINVNDVSIKYMTGDYRNIGLKEFVIRKITNQYDAREFWAVKNVSFSLKKGDFLGIIGNNGAGKTTLLRAISGVLKPQFGSIETHGKISAILNLGTGFDGDMNLKDNVYLKGAILGYTEEYMDEMYPLIIEFSELQGFEDRKLRQLSSGMKSRLAFSVASLIEPEILILDEVLSVGDNNFREKSEKKMMEIINHGSTTLFVSHNITQIRRLSNKVLWLDKGEQMAFGDTKLVCDEYEDFLKCSAGRHLS